MNDERFERHIRAALERDARPLPPALRARLSAIPDEFPRGRRSRRITQLFAAAGALAAVLVLAVAALVLVGLHNTTIGPAASPTPSAPATAPAVVAPASPTEATATATPSVVAPVPGPWSGLRWSAPTAFPSPMGVDGVVAFGGRLYAIGQVQAGSGVETVVWRSSDGTTWTNLLQGGATFAGSGVLNLLATPSGLVAWGQDGEPVCTAPGAGQTCGPVPQMVWTSADGFTWMRATGVSALSGATIRSIAAGPSGLVAVGETGSGSPVIWTSADGAAWARLSLGSAFADAHFWTVRATGPGFLIGGGTGTQQVSVTGGPASTVPVDAAVWWSADGRAWTKGTLRRSTAGGAYVSGIFVGADGMVAVGSASGGKEGAAWTSSDGRTWIPIAASYTGLPSPPPSQPVLPSYTIIDDGTHMVAIGTTSGLVATWWSSTDGTTWQPLAPSGATETTPAQQGDIAYADRWFDRAFVVPGGVIAAGSGTGSPDAPGRVWVATAESALSPATADRCQASQLRVHGGRMGGGTGTAQAQIYATNTSAAPCTLSGFPVAVELLRADGSALPTVMHAPSASPEPPMTLAPGVPDAASLGLNWQNWCGGDPGPLRIRITLQGGAGSVTGALNGPPGGSFVPRCDQPTQTSAIEVLWSFGPSS
jgi:Domain of unknown function (DUF4232)